MRGTEIRHHSHARPSRPPQKPTETEVARVAPKSGTTVTHGQVGPPKSPHRQRLRAWHRNPAPQSRMAKSAPQPHPTMTQSPSQTKDAEVTRVAPKSGTTSTHGQIGPPKNLKTKKKVRNSRK